MTNLTQFSKHRHNPGVLLRDAIAPGMATATAAGARKRGALLGREVLQQVRLDMSRTIYPSYVGRPPAEVGSASAGSLSADQWRTFGLVNLVITLVRLWGRLPVSDERIGFLNNFVDLVVAVRLGTTRRVTPQKIQSYQSRISDYARGLLEQFPDEKLVTNHHLALHLGEVLHRFGPTQSYWAFPFERCIRLIRDVNNNFRPSTSPFCWWRVIY